MKQLGPYLNGLYAKNPMLSTLITNYNLRYVEVEKFEKHFGVMTREEIVVFILDPDNGYELSKFGHESTEYILSGIPRIHFMTQVYMEATGLWGEDEDDDY